MRRYNPENLATLERYVDTQARENAYDLEANLAVLKLWVCCYYTHISCSCHVMSLFCCNLSSSSVIWNILRHIWTKIISQIYICIGLCVCVCVLSGTSSIQRTSRPQWQHRFCSRLSQTCLTQTSHCASVWSTRPTYPFRAQNDDNSLISVTTDNSWCI